MPRGRPVDDAKRARVLELHAEGVGRNGIARELGMSGAAVTKVIQDAGRTFERTDTAVATEARRHDLAAMRADLAHRALVKAGHFLDALDRPFLVFNFGGKDNTYEEHLLSGPPTGDIKNLMTAYGIAVQRSLELDRADSDGGQAAAVSVVDGLMQAFRGAVALLPDPVTVTESTPNSV